MNQVKSIWEKRIRPNAVLYLMLVPAVTYILIFNYFPMYGVQIAFKDFIPSKGIWGSPWVGFKHFERFFTIPQFRNVLLNTLGISLYQLSLSFPFPIILALMLNYSISKKVGKTVQMVTYSAHFISTVVMVGILLVLLSPRSGIVNHLIELLGGQRINFMAEASLFKSIYVWSEIWQNTGWGSIIYIATLSSINPELHEAAIVDGATRLQRIRYVDIPSILPTAMIMLILSSGRIMSIGFEKAFLMQNPLNLQSSEIISTYVYKVGLLNFQYSFSAAVGLFNNLINVTLILIVNRLSKKYSDVSL